MPYYPVIQPLLPLTVTTVFPTANPTTSYQAYDDLTSLTEQLVTNNTKKILGEDEPGTVSFYNQNSILLPPVGSGFVTVTSLTVPTGYDGVIKKIQNNLTGGGFITGSGDVVWQIVADDIPVKNYDSILTERGDPNAPAGVNSIRIYSGQTISYVINHVNNPTLSGYTVAGLVGYFYPQGS